MSMAKVHKAYTANIRVYMQCNDIILPLLSVRHTSCYSTLTLMFFCIYMKTRDENEGEKCRREKKRKK